MSFVSVRRQADGKLGYPGLIKCLFTLHYSLLNVWWHHHTQTTHILVQNYFVVKVESWWSFELVATNLEFLKNKQAKKAASTPSTNLDEVKHSKMKGACNALTYGMTEVKKNQAWVGHPLVVGTCLVYVRAWIRILVSHIFKNSNIQAEKKN